MACAKTSREGYLSGAKHLPVRTPPLELEPNRELAIARLVRCTGDFAEIGVSHERIGCSETNRVGDIKELGSQFQLHSLSHREVLEQTHVSIPDPFPAHIRGKTRRVARYLVVRNTEAIAVVVACVGVVGESHVMQAEPGPGV